MPVPNDSSRSGCAMLLFALIANTLPVSMSLEPPNASATGLFSVTVPIDCAAGGLASSLAGSSAPASAVFTVKALGNVIVKAEGST